MLVSLAHVKVLQTLSSKMIANPTYLNREV